MPTTTPSCAPRTSPYAPGETDAVIYEAAGCLPATAPGVTATIAATPAPTATPPSGSGITCPSVWAAANPITGLVTDLVIEVVVSATAVPGDYPVAILFTASNGAIKPRVLIVPVRASF